MARRKPISPLRDQKSLHRAAGRKPPRSITLIVCEGETEQEYFEAARIHYGLATAEVIVAPNTVGPAPISVVECAEKKCGEQGGYDQVYCVIDRDGHESFVRARDRIRALANRKRNALPMGEAISVPCFELWVLLHFERTDAPFNRCDDVIARVRVHMTDYQKADAGICRQLLDRVEVAVQNAGWLEQRAADNAFNPYSSVHHVLRHFAQVSSQRVNA